MSEQGSIIPRAQLIFCDGQITFEAASIFSSMTVCTSLEDHLAIFKKIVVDLESLRLNMMKRI